MSGSSQTVSRDKLWSYDAGQHTCTVTDEDGNIGRATMEMNIIGTCIPIRIINYKMNQAVATWEYHFSIYNSIQSRFDITSVDMCMYGKCICLD